MRRQIPIALAAGTAACQLLVGISGDARFDGGMDATADANADVDVDASDGGCDPNAMFEPGTPLDAFTTIDYEHAIQFSRDELTAFFSRSPFEAGVKNESVLFISSRPHLDAAFAVPTALPFSVQGDASNHSPSPNASASELFFDSYRPTRDIWVTRRDDAGVFGDAEPVQLSLTGEHYDPFIVPAALWFTSNAEPNSLGIYRATRTGNLFAKPKLFEIGTSFDAGAISDRTPVVTPDELVIFWARSGSGVSNEIWTAHRSSVSEEFRDARPVTELNTTDWDVPTWITPDACTLYFMTNHDRVSYDLFSARRKR